MAGYSFFIIRNRACNINVFLNICYYRAFPIVCKNQEKVIIFLYKYYSISRREIRNSNVLADQNNVVE